ncbi:MAG: hydroxyisourate hydrolase [Rhodobacteraceae bacterium]|nr:hydroxyisourate hydrolase [Paracoccaceae bacterium]
MTGLKINILDSSTGKKAEGVLVQLRKISDGEWLSYPDVITGANGHALLCAEKDITDGGYFEVLVLLGQYFDKKGLGLPPIKLVDIIPLRFGLEKAEGDVVIHLSATPFGYTFSFSTSHDPATPVLT